MNVRLVGWPKEVLEVFNDYTEPVFKSILNAIDAGTCYWERLPPSAAPARQRKERSDKGVERKGKKRKMASKTPDTVETGEHAPFFSPVWL